MAKAKVIPIIKASPIQALVDELGELNEQRKKLETREDQLKTQLKTFGAGVYDGKVFVAMSTDKTRSSYKAELLRIHVTEEVLNKCSVTSAYLEIKLQRRSPT
jgi:hypothetical protein